MDYWLIGAWFAGALCAWAVLRFQHDKALAQQQAKAQQELTQQTHQLQNQIATLQHAATQQQANVLSLQETLTAQSESLAQSREARAALESRLAVLQQETAQWQQNLQSVWKQQLESFVLANLTQVRELAQTEYTQRQTHLDQHVKTLLAPLTEQLDVYRKQVETVHKEHHAGKELLLHEVKRLGEGTQKLTQALSFNKGRGNWGELELKRLLEDSGLVEGVGYVQQVTLGDGKRRPDVQILLPEGRSLFIDAKALQVDLNDTPEDENRAEKALKSLKEAVKTLADRAYQQDLDTDFVILYVPRESMLSWAYEADVNLFQWAYHQRVILAGPLNLMATLRLVHHSWKLARLSEDASAILDLGTQVYKQASVFADRYAKLGKQLETLNKTYHESWTALEGQQGLAGKIRKLNDYGCDGGGKRLPDLLPLPDGLVFESTLQ